MKKFEPIEYSSQIILLVGDAGSGKTFFALQHPNREKGFYFDMEHRYNQTLKPNKQIKIKELRLEGQKLLLGRENYDTKKFVGEEFVDTKKVTPGIFYMPLIYDKDYEVDKIASFKVIDAMLSRIFNTPEIELIVMDGIEDLRRMASEKWETENKKTAFGFQAWGEINNDVKRILHRMFNYARLMNKQIIITTHFTRIYNDNGEATKETEINAKDYILDRVDEVLAFKRDGITFYIKRGKSPRGPTDLQEITFEKEENVEEKEHEKIRTPRSQQK